MKKKVLQGQFHLGPDEWSGHLGRKDGKDTVSEKDNGCGINVRSRAGFGCC